MLAEPSSRQPRTPPPNTSRKRFGAFQKSRAHLPPPPLGDKPPTRLGYARRYGVWLRPHVWRLTALFTLSLIGIAIDVTAQKNADRLNQEAELRLKDAIENISEAFVLWNPNNELVLCNSKYQQFHSLPASVCAAPA